LRLPLPASRPQLAPEEEHLAAAQLWLDELFT
jgi:hypothetical protein